MPAGSAESILETERLVLQAICQGTPEGSIRDTAQRLLADYRWREPSHRVIFEVLMSMPTGRPQLLRDQLATRITRRGFPDLDWEKMFAPHNLNRAEAERLMTELASTDPL